jgi:hypothetical protein
MPEQVRHDNATYYKIIRATSAKLLIYQFDQIGCQWLNGSLTLDTRHLKPFLL